jgi:hypothetical protein
MQRSMPLRGVQVSHESAPDLMGQGAQSRSVARGAAGLCPVGGLLAAILLSDMAA